jgi:hypothetical protein
MYTSRGFLANPDYFYTPKISISPYDLKANTGISYVLDNDFSAKNSVFKILGNNVETSISGKDAILRVFKESIAKDSKTIAIVTTSGNRYVSKCVTDMLEKNLSKSIVDLEGADVIYIIHEFGKIIKEEIMRELRNQNKIIINDFAYSFGSLYYSGRSDFQNEINLTSLPKFLPVSHGGLYSIPSELKKQDDEDTNPGKDLILKIEQKVLSESYLISSNLKRKENLNKILMNIKRCGIESYFDESEFVPGVAMLKSSIQLDLDKLKVDLNRVGIESSIFYGENAFFVPVHQNLTELEIDYISSMVDYFVK